MNAALIHETAERFARDAHAGQIDKLGRDYAEHHLRPVAESLAMFGGAVVAVGWLHDVLEDTTTSEADLYDAGFGGRYGITEQLVTLTRIPGENYLDDYIARINRDPVARLVKLADLHVNLSSNPALAAVDAPTARRLRERYLRAQHRLLTAVFDD